MRTNANQDSSGAGNLLALSTGVFAGPLAVLLQLQINYALVPWVCTTGHHFVLYLVTSLAVILAGVGGMVAWAEWQRTGRQWPDGSGGIIPRNRFIAVVGLLLSVFSVIINVALGIPNFILNPCQP